MLKTQNIIRSLSITHLTSAQKNHSNSSTNLTFSIFSESIENCKDSITVPRASNEAVHLEEFIKELNSDATKEGLISPNLLQTKHFLTRLLQTGTPQKAWEGAILLYKNNCLPNLISEEILPNENWLHLVARSGIEPKDFSDEFTSLSKRINDLVAINTFKKNNINEIETPEETEHQLSLPIIETAIAADNLEAFKIFLECGLGFNYSTNHAKSNQFKLIHLAAIFGAEKISEFLLTHRFCNSTHKEQPAGEHTNTNGPTMYSLINVNKPGPNNETPLMLAARHGHLRLVDQLLKKSADLFSERIDGQLAHTLAKKYGQTIIYDFLLQKTKALSDSGNLKAKLILAHLQLLDSLPNDWQKFNESELEIIFAESRNQDESLGFLHSSMRLLKNIENEASLIQSLQWLIKASKKGSGRASFLLFKILENNLILQTILTNHETPFDYLKKSAEQYEPNGLIQLAELNLSNQIPGQSQPNYQTAFELLELAAKLGNSLALTKLGDMYFSGLTPNSTTLNLHQAFKLYKQAADLNNSLAQLKLGEMYLYAKAPNQTEPNLQEAIRWFTVSSQQGNLSARQYLSRIQGPTS